MLKALVSLLTRKPKPATPVEELDGAFDVYLERLAQRLKDEQRQTFADESFAADEDDTANFEFEEDSDA